MMSKLDLMEDKSTAETFERQLLAYYKEAAGDLRPAPRFLRRPLAEVGLQDLCELQLGGSSKPRRSSKSAPSIASAGHTHEEFPTHSFVVGRAFDRQRFEAWAATVKGLLRAKGLLWVQGEGPGSFVWHFAGSRNSALVKVEGAEPPRGSELVFIGRYGPDWSPSDLDRGLQACR